ncbi:MAG: glycosyltransferase [Phenylobacterium sp.]|uniref:glycosyltransferase n=1 Tax=Phenylobacterium sp. TaxID=1871053 RepID=UPI00272780CC|nr:glycosyltransferase [Phenylobacterium sp.]MDO8900036.1 glycosyltransferase [Phenylobacterium sp.]
MVIFARIARMRIYVHHHVFSYVDNPTDIARLFFKICGADATHIVLCKGMAEKLVLVYGRDIKVRILSNANLVSPPPVKPSSRHELNSVGFLGNITLEKGIADFIQVAEIVQSQDSAVKFSIAGPVPNEQLSALITGFVSRSPANRVYLGPVYASEKEKFFDNIDLLLFPSRYKNEAEPVTIYEALSRNVAVLATARGCVPSQLAAECVWADADGFAAWAADRIRAGRKNPSMLDGWLRSAPLAEIVSVKSIFDFGLDVNDPNEAIINEGSCEK